MRPFASNIPKPEHTVTELKEETDKNPVFVHLDLGNRGNCESAAKVFLRAEKELHAIYDSRHIIAPGLSSRNFYDYDMQFSKVISQEKPEAPEQG